MVDLGMGRDVWRRALGRWYVVAAADACRWQSRIANRCVCPMHVHVNLGEGGVKRAAEHVFSGASVERVPPGTLSQKGPARDPFELATVAGDGCACALPKGYVPSVTHSSRQQTSLHPWCAAPTCRSSGCQHQSCQRTQTGCCCGDCSPS